MGGVRIRESGLARWGVREGGRSGAGVERKSSLYRSVGACPTGGGCGCSCYQIIRDGEETVKIQQRFYRFVFPKKEFQVLFRT